MLDETQPMCLFKKANVSEAMVNVNNMDSDACPHLLQ